MKGTLYYEEADAVRNKGFIEALMKAGMKDGILMKLVHQEEEIPDETEFILFRSRNPELAKVLENIGHRLFNRAEVNKIANDKLKTFQLAQLLGISTIPTKLLKRIGDIGEYPAVLKTVDGHGGQEVELCNNQSEAEQFVETKRNRQIIIQPYIESESTDVRVFVIGEDVVGAVKRIGQNSFKSNFTLGGKVENYLVPSSMEQAAITIARGLKSDYIGIDFLLVQDGTWILNEIEDPVGARSFYETQEADIAELLMQHIKKEVSG